MNNNLRSIGVCSILRPYIASLAILSVLVIVVCLRASAAGAQKLGEFDTVEVGSGAYAFIAPETAAANGNSLAIIGTDGVLVVDSGLIGARNVIAAIRRLTSEPVRYLVNTHWHGDHWSGNYLYKEAFPDVVIISSDETRRLLLDKLPEYQNNLLKNRDILEQRKQMLAKGIDAEGKPMTAPYRELLTRQIQDMEIGVPEYEKIKPEVPTVTLHDVLTIYLGGREIRLMHLGRGNTAGDTMIYVPDAHLLETGDAVVAPVPYFLGSYPTEWIHVLNQIMAMDVSTIVPGHGPVMHDKTYVQSLLDLFTYTRDQVRAAAQDGLSLDEVQKKVDFSSFRKQFAGDSYQRGRVFDRYFAAPAIEQNYKESKGEPLVE